MKKVILSISFICVLSLTLIAQNASGKKNQVDARPTKALKSVKTTKSVKDLKPVTRVETMRKKSSSDAEHPCPHHKAMAKNSDSEKHCDHHKAMAGKSSSKASCCTSDKKMSKVDKAEEDIKYYDELKPAPSNKIKEPLQKAVPMKD